MSELSARARLASEALRVPQDREAAGRYDRRPRRSSQRRLVAFLGPFELAGALQALP